jgi:hypothetical protein
MGLGVFQMRATVILIQVVVLTLTLYAVTGTAQEVSDASNILT